MGPLEIELTKVGINPVYSFTKRESIEEVTSNGVKKTSIFKHVGWIEGATVMAADSKNVAS